MLPESVVSSVTTAQFKILLDEHRETGISSVNSNEIHAETTFETTSFFSF